jgi:hypothetical protein
MKSLIVVFLLCAVSAQAGVYRHAVKPAAKFGAQSAKVAGKASAKAVKVLASGAKKVAY